MRNVFLTTISYINIYQKLLPKNQLEEVGFFCTERLRNIQLYGYMCSSIYFGVYIKYTIYLFDSFFDAAYSERRSIRIQFKPNTIINDFQNNSMIIYFLKGNINS